MRRLLWESLFGFLFVACAVATLLAAIAFAAPAVFPEPFATVAAESNLWVAATAALTVLAVMFLLLALRLFV